MSLDLYVVCLRVCAECNSFIGVQCCLHQFYILRNIPIKYTFLHIKCSLTRRQSVEKLHWSLNRFNFQLLLNDCSAWRRLLFLHPACCSIRLPLIALEMRQTLLNKSYSTSFEREHRLHHLRPHWRLGHVVVPWNWLCCAFPSLSSLLSCESGERCRRWQ